ncbi:MAG: Serine/threonine-protein kinase PknD [Thermoanaerobaculia bacterium]|nr:Serine/threonine-protein kinase PknD [Thermoanaerobaculia bacterium]
MKALETKSTRSQAQTPAPAVGWGRVGLALVLALTSWGITAVSFGPVARVDRTPANVLLSLLASAFVLTVYLTVAVLLARARTADPAPKVLLVLLPVLGVGHSQDFLELGSVPPGFFGAWDVFLRQGIPALSAGPILAFLAVFPSETRFRKAIPGLLAAFSVGPFAWAVFDFMRLGPEAFNRPSIRLLLCNLLVIAANVSAIVRLVSGALSASTERDRQRARIVLFPTAAWVLLLVLVNNLSFLLQSRTGAPVFLAALLSVIFPLSLSAAVLKTKLFQIDRLIRLGLARVTASALLVLAFLFAAPALASRAAVAFPASEGVRELAAGALAAALVLLMTPLRDQLQRAIDASFYKTRDDPYRLLLAAMVPEPSRPGSAAGPTEISDHVRQVLNPERQWLWIDDGQPEPARGDEPGATRPQEELGRPDPGSTRVMSARSPRRLRAAMARYSADPVLVLSEVPAAEEPVFQELGDEGFEILIPLTGSRMEVLGLWALGPKKSEEPYGSREKEALGALARAMALHIERDRLASQVEFERMGRQKVEGASLLPGGAEFHECPLCGLCSDGGGTCPAEGAVMVSVQAGPRTVASRYRLDQRIGRGGMGAVYRAYDTVLRRDVAVKLIRQDQAGHEISRQRFRQEALLAARLQHPNAVAVFDTGEFPAGAYHVMELVEGSNLAIELRQRGRLPFAEGWPYIEGMLSALAAAHDVGLVHRDVKPSNLLLARGRSGDLTVKLADFGLARGVEGEAGLPVPSDLTRTGTIVGSPGYMAPEVMSGRPATPASDVWAAAVTSYEILSGKKAFTGASLVEIYEFAKAELFEPLSRLAPDVPLRFAAVLEAALSASPKRRPRTAGRLLEALRASV